MIQITLPKFIAYPVAAIWAITLPLRVALWAAELVVSVAFIYGGYLVYSWWTGAITDAQVAEFVGHVADRAIIIAQHLGVM